MYTAYIATESSVEYEDPIPERTPELHLVTEEWL